MVQTPETEPASRATGAIERLSRLCGHDADVNALLEWIEPPASAQALPLVLEGLRDLLPVMRDLAADKPDLFDVVDNAKFDALRSGLEEIAPVLRNLPAELELAEVRPSPRRPKQPFRGVMSGYPLYTLIGTWRHFEARDAKAKTMRPALAAIVLFAKVRSVMQHGADDGATPLYAGAKAARQMLESAAIPESWSMSLSGLIDGIRGSEAQYRSVADEGVRHAELRRLVEPVLRARGLIAERPPNGAPADHVVVIELQQALPTDRIDVQRELRLHTSTKDDLERDGLTPGEFDTAEEYIEWTEYGEDWDAEASPAGVELEPLERSLAEQVIRARSLIGRRERAAQLLACDWIRPADVEIAALWATLKLRPTASPDDQEREIRALLAVTLWTGRPVQEVARMQIINRREKAPEQWSAGLLMWALDTRDLAASVLRPVGQPKHSGTDLGQALPTVDRIVLNVDDLLGDFLVVLPNSASLASSERVRPAMAFATPTRTLIEAARSWVREHAKQEHGRLTLAMVETWMFRCIVEHRRDHALASLLTGRPHQLADTGLHYLSVSADEAAQWLRAEQRQRMAELSRADLPIPYAIAEDREIRAQIGKAVTTVVGARVVPRLEVIDRMVRSLRKELDLQRGMPMASDARLKLHNAYTQYVHAMLRFGLGMRDVGQPLPNWERIDTKNMVVLLSDKDDVASTATRIAPLCPTLSRQLQLYAKHWRATWAKLLSHSCDSLPPVLFYLLRKGSHVQMIERPTAEMRQQFKLLSGYGLPLNSSRHWLRTRLAQKGVPGEMIEAFMGHWQRGAEPWGRYSALPARVVTETLRPMLEDLVCEAGFRALRGWA